MNAFDVGVADGVEKTATFSPSSALKGIRKIESGARRQAQPIVIDAAARRAARRQLNRSPASGLAGIREVDSGARRQPQPRRRAATAAAPRPRRADPQPRRAADGAKKRGGGGGGGGSSKDNDGSIMLPVAAGSIAALGLGAGLYNALKIPE